MTKLDLARIYDHLGDAQTKSVYFGFTKDAMTVAVNEGRAYALNNRVNVDECTHISETRVWILKMLKMAAEDGIHILLQLNSDTTLTVLMLNSPGLVYDFDSLAENPYDYRFIYGMYGVGKVFEYVKRVSSFATSMTFELLESCLSGTGVNATTIMELARTHEEVLSIELGDVRSDFRFSKVVHQHILDYLSECLLVCV